MNKGLRCFELEAALLGIRGCAVLNKRLDC